MIKEVKWSFTIKCVYLMQHTRENIFLSRVCYETTVRMFSTSSPEEPTKHSSLGMINKQNSRLLWVLPFSCDFFMNVQKKRKCRKTEQKLLEASIQLDQCAHTVHYWLNSVWKLVSIWMNKCMFFIILVFSGSRHSTLVENCLETKELVLRLIKMLLNTCECN